MGLRWSILIAALALSLGWTSPVEAQWLKAESPNFIVYGTGAENRLYDRVAVLEDYDWLLRTLTGAKTLPPAAKLPVYLVRGPAQLRLVNPGMSQGARGFYAARVSGTAAFVDETYSMGNRPGEQGNDVLFHEYAHHFMLRYFPAAYPAWYVEGFAEYMMTARFDGARVEYGGIAPSRARWLTSAGDWLPTERLLFGSPDKLSDEDAARFYAQSWITVHYFFSDRERRAALVRYLTALGRGDDPRSSFERETGLTPMRLEAALRRYIKGRGIPVVRLVRGSATKPPRIEIERLPPSADRLVLLDAALTLGVGESYAGRYLKRVRKLAGAYADDPFAQKVLAQAEALHGDGVAADRLLAGLLRKTPADGELLYLRGMRHLVAARSADDPNDEHQRARDWFAQAYSANPNHYPTLFRYAESRDGTPAYYSQNNGDILLLASQIAPQVGSIRISAGGVLMGLDRFAEARYLLAPLAGDPHAGGLAAAAREMIDVARQEQELAESDDDADDDSDGDDPA